MDKHRLEALTDGIFAFAMTLLVLGIEVPDETTAAFASPTPVQDLLSSLTPDFTHYFVAFIILAAFWILHHSFTERIRSVDRKMLWLNITGLLFVALIPFSTDLADSYVGYPISAMVFELNVFLVGALFFLQWSYASKGRRFISPETTDAEISYLNRAIGTMPAISLAAMCVAAAGIGWSAMLFWLVPFFYLLPAQRK
ncbi:Uncharacterised protein [uncultured archaeon]|nr:Uncharacterised protein [uncultured archaeon]